MKKASFDAVCKALQEADTQETAPGVEVRIVSLDTLLSMKAAAGRPQDLAEH